VAAKRVVIVGGGGTGDYAAFALRKKGFDGDIRIISGDDHRPYDRPYLSKEFLRGEVELPKVFLHSEDDYSNERIDLGLNQKVVGGSMSSRTLSLEKGSDVHFEILVLGLGGTPRWLPGVPHADNVHTLRSLDDSQALRKAIKGSTRLLLIGAGFIGAEVAASARQLG
jgi:3-phenylpropionate/trans-cinnamate dioxygenase ferredoxin reductase subunit